MAKVVVPYRPRNWARPFHASFKRFGCLVLHRRAGKTTCFLNHHIRAALNDNWERARLRFLKPDITDAQLEELVAPPGGRHYGHILPLRNQAKLVVWDKLKYYAQAIPGVEFNEAELLMRTPNGNKFQLFGADNPDSLRGPAFSGLSFDEYSQMSPSIFGEVLSKSLADHLGYAYFGGTIKGRNHLFKTYEASKGDPSWFSLWQDVDQSLETEDDIAISIIRQAMADDLALIAKGLMTQSEFEQEWYLSPEAALRGSYYGELLKLAEKQGRICRVPMDPLMLVDTDWDIGMDDETTIWFSQSTRSGEVRLVDYLEGSGEGLPFYAREIQRLATERGYVYGQHWAPHDIQVREWGGTGKSRRETAAGLGIKFLITPKWEIAEGINAVRMLLPRCWFDAERCKVGLEALRQYVKTWNQRLESFTATPVHNWASNGSDSFRGLAVRHKTPKDAERPRQDYGAHINPADAWMS